MYHDWIFATAIMIMAACTSKSFSNNKKLDIVFRWSVFFLSVPLWIALVFSSVNGWSSLFLLVGLMWWSLRTRVLAFASVPCWLLQVTLTHSNMTFFSWFLYALRFLKAFGCPECASFPLLVLGTQQEDVDKLVEELSDLLPMMSSTMCLRQDFREETHRHAPSLIYVEELSWPGLGVIR